MQKEVWRNEREYEMLQINGKSIIATSLSLLTPA